MNEEFAQQLVAELLHVNEQSFALLANAIGDVIGRSELAAAIDARLTTAQAASIHPMAAALLRTVAQTLQAS